MVGLLFWIMPATSILVSGITYAVALGWKFRLTSLIYAGLGLMFAAIGNYLPKCRPNRTVASGSPGRWAVRKTGMQPTALPVRSGSSAVL